MSGPAFWAIWGSGLVAGGVVVAVWFAHALYETRGVTLRRLFRDWAQTGRQQ